MKRKILIVQLRQLGDILLTTPVIRALKDADPDCTVSFLSHPMGRLVLSGNPLLNEHIILPAAGLAAQWRCLMELRQKKFDLVFDFMGNPRSALATKITGAPSRVGFAARRGWAYTQLVERVSGSDYIVKEKFRMLAAAGLAGRDERLILPWKASDLDVSRPFLDQFPKNRTRIVLSATHRRLDRRWKSDSWVSLANALLKQDALIFWAWGPGEEDEIRAIQSKTLGPTYLMPKTSFKELAAFFSQCDLFIGNSNGPSHVAVSVNTPSLQIHGPTDAPSWCPMTLRHRALAKQKIEDISVGEVLEVLEDVDFKGAIHASTQARDHISDFESVWSVRPNL